MSHKYRFLPFQFKRFGQNFLLVNEIGEFHFVDEMKFQRFTNKSLDPSSDDCLDLISKHFACIDHLPQTIDLLATAYRTKKRYLYDFTSLHMFVITHRCNQKCEYCHASSEGDDIGKCYDMDIVTVKKCIDLALGTPSKRIKFEFQGGEPLVSFDVVREIITYTKDSIQPNDKHVEFVLCTNLTMLKEWHLSFIREHKICVSTSLDGPQFIHDQCRKTRSGNGTYNLVRKNIKWASEWLGKDQISALMTVTRFNIEHLTLVIDEYVRAGFQSIFLRMMNPHGYAIDAWDRIGYTVDEFVKAYETALDYIIDLNIRGVFFIEEYATLLLTKILTPFSTGFVDLQSPSGAGLSGVVYETNGDVYIADEARMLAKRTGDKTFCMGNVHTDSYESIFCGKKLFNFAKTTTIEANPGCAWCVYQTYCGSDPIRNYIEGDEFEFLQSKGDFCKKHRAIFDLLFQYLIKQDDRIVDVFWSWITHRSLSELKLGDSIKK